MDKIITEHNHLQYEINIEMQRNSRQNPLIEQIDQWQRRSIEKIKRAAAQARQEASELWNAQRVQLNIEFESFSQELAYLKESKNYAEHDLIRLNQMIKKFQRDLDQSTQSMTIVLHTERSDSIDWGSLIYVEERTASTYRRWEASANRRWEASTNRRSEASVISKLMSYIFWQIFSSGYFEVKISDIIQTT